MLNHFGIDTFVGGNLGTPLSEAAIQHVTSPAQECKLKVGLIDLSLFPFSVLFACNIHVNIFQVAVVEVSSYQMAIPCVYFRPSVSRLGKFLDNC